jgi:hypothetical protein
VNAEPKKKRTILDIKRERQAAIAFAPPPPPTPEPLTPAPEATAPKVRKPPPGRLPAGATFALHYDGTRELWVGRLSVPHAGVTKDFTGECLGVHQLLKVLGRQCFDWIKQTKGSPVDAAPAAS